MEASAAYWSSGTVVLERQHRNRLLRVIVVPPEKELPEMGYLACFVIRKNGTIEGVFRASRTVNRGYLEGYLSKRLHIEYEGDKPIVDAEVYGFPGVILPDAGQAAATIEYVASLLDYEYLFPDKVGAFRIDGRLGDK